jgi:hypothetical protein
MVVIRQLTNVRLIYGNRRTTNLLNRFHRASGAEPPNHKKIDRLMQQDRLLLLRHETRRSGPTKAR